MSFGAPNQRQKKDRRRHRLGAGVERQESSRLTQHPGPEPQPSAERWSPVLLTHLCHSWLRKLAKPRSTIRASSFPWLLSACRVYLHLLRMQVPHGSVASGCQISRRLQSHACASGSRPRSSAGVGCPTRIECDGLLPHRMPRTSTTSAHSSSSTGTHPGSRSFQRQEEHRQPSARGCSAMLMTAGSTSLSPPEALP